MGAVPQVTSLGATGVESLSGYLSSDGCCAIAVRPWVVHLSALSLVSTVWPLLHQQLRKLPGI